MTDTEIEIIHGTIRAAQCVVRIAKDLCRDIYARRTTITSADWQQAIQGFQDSTKVRTTDSEFSTNAIQLLHNAVPKLAESGGLYQDWLAASCPRDTLPSFEQFTDDFNYLHERMTSLETILKDGVPKAGPSMSQTEWEDCHNALAMLEATPTTGHDIELLSFAAAICRRLKHILPRESRHALDVLKDYLAGRARKDAVLIVHADATKGRWRSIRNSSFKPVRIQKTERIAKIVQVATSLDARNAATEAALACNDLLDENSADLLREFLPCA